MCIFVAPNEQEQSGSQCEYTPWLPTVATRSEVEPPAYGRLLMAPQQAVTLKSKLASERRRLQTLSSTPSMAFKVKRCVDAAASLLICLLAN